MHDLVGVQVPKRYQDLSADELDSLLGEAAVLAKEIKNVPASDVLKEKVDSELVLKHVVHGENEGVFCLEKNVFFGPSVDDLAFFNQDVFVNSLHRVFLSVICIYNQKNFSERAFVNDFLDFEIFEGQILQFFVSTLQLFSVLD